MMPFRYTIFFAVAALGIPLLVAAQVPERQVAEKRTPPTQSIADSLDRIIQPLFQKDVGAFGVSRLVPYVAGHNALGGSYTFAPTFKPNRAARTAEEQEAARHVEDARRPGNDFVIAFLHITHTPGQVKETIPRPAAKPIQERLSVLAVRDDKTQLFFTFPDSADNYGSGRNTGNPDFQKRAEGAKENATLVTRWEQAAKNALPLLKQGKPVESAVGDYVLAMRPVQAKQESCLGCHTGAKQDETLGVMVYAIAKNSPRTAQK
jgi:hypothetical protein